MHKHICPNRSILHIFVLYQHICRAHDWKGFDLEQLIMVQLSEILILFSTVWLWKKQQSLGTYIINIWAKL